ncbi:MAG: ABC transporter [Clostridiales bacterium]|nr:MAG: ABC transporter [Clostridiales bacterium]
MGVALRQLISRNTKLYFKDKSMFLTSMITPMILFILFITFLRSVYEKSFISFIPEGMSMDQSIVDAFTVSWLLSSIIAVSSVTVAFCSNIIMAQDKLNGTIHDIIVAPIKKSTLAISYYISNVISTAVICYAVMVLGFVYISMVGWYFSVTDVLLIMLDIFICVIFGTALAALVDNFLKTQGSVGAVSSLVSALYGFLCGAYMPISQFSEPIRNFVSILPGTYGTALLRSHYLNGVLSEVNKTMPDELVNGVRDSFDANLYFFGNRVEVWQMYTVLIFAVVVVLAAYIIINCFDKKKKI